MFPLKDENPTRRRPILTYTLIVSNVAIFIGTLATGALGSESFLNAYGMRPAEVLAGRQLHTLFTSMFLHGGIFHIIFNMWYLWIFADNIEDVLGRGRFLLFYFGAGLVASFAHAFANPGSSVPAIGASGAIAGILGGYLVLYPWARVHTAVVFFYIIHLITIPALVMIGFWFVLQVLSASITWMAGVHTGIAYMAHIGGFLAGVLLILPFRRAAESELPRGTRDLVIKHIAENHPELSDLLEGVRWEGGRVPSKDPDEERFVYYGVKVGAGGTWTLELSRTLVSTGERYVGPPSGEVFRRIRQRGAPGLEATARYQATFLTVTWRGVVSGPRVTELAYEKFDRREAGRYTLRWRWG
jgi:membrane associated rhomboid family serine protease